MISKEKQKELLSLAEKATENSYSPYSDFPVGACALTKSGKLFTGTNVENASYGLTICAERVAVCKAVTSGHRDIVAVAIFTKNKSISPCGACRQFIAEFGEDIEIIYKKGSQFVSESINKLLPNSFCKKELS